MFRGLGFRVCSSLNQGKEGRYFRELPMWLQGVEVFCRALKALSGYRLPP